MQLGNGDARIMTVGRFHCKTLKADVLLNVVKCFYPKL